LNIDFSQPRSLVYIFVGLLIGLGLGYFFIFRPTLTLPVERGTIAVENSNPAELETAPQAGALAPDFALQTIDGRQVRLSDFRGRPVLINFWATWCGPCRLEMPGIQAKFEEHAPELVVLAVDFDEPANAVRSFSDELGLTFDVLLDPGGEVNSQVYRVRGYPSSFFVDEDGVIRVVQIGLMTEGQLEDYLNEVGLSG
jgi:peroxiredoxin